jgi:hypothetical protein
MKVLYMIRTIIVLAIYWLQVGVEKVTWIRCQPICFDFESFAYHMLTFGCLCLNQYHQLLFGIPSWNGVALVCVNSTTFIFSYCRLMDSPHSCSANVHVITTTSWVFAHYSDMDIKMACFHVFFRHKKINKIIFIIIIKKDSII